MKMLAKLVAPVMLVGTVLACHRPKPQEKPVEEKTQLVPDPVESASSPPSPPVVPTPRKGHPGTITYVTKWDGSSKTESIANIPDRFAFHHGVPIVREEYYTWDAAGNPCPPALAASGEILRYGPDGQLVQTVTRAPRPPPPPPSASPIDPRYLTRWPRP
jgi:hypothetical protein